MFVMVLSNSFHTDLDPALFEIMTEDSVCYTQWMVFRTGKDEDDLLECSEEESAIPQLLKSAIQNEAIAVSTYAKGHNVLL